MQLEWRADAEWGLAQTHGSPVCCQAQHQYSDAHSQSAAQHCPARVCPALAALAEVSNAVR